MTITDDMVERHAKSLADSLSYAWHDAAVRRKLRKVSKAALTAALEGSVAVPDEAAIADVLRPFAEASHDLHKQAEDGDHIWESPAAMNLTAGQLRRAAELLGLLGSMTRQDRLTTTKVATGEHHE